MRKDRDQRYINNANSVQMSQSNKSTIYTNYARAHILRKNNSRMLFAIVQMPMATRK